MATGLKMPEQAAPQDMTRQDGAPPQPTGKGNAPTQIAQPNQPQPMGKGGNYQTSATSGQPRAGMPNNYSNTVGQSDNTQIQQPHGGGKGKG
jgi:hypothetical protein